MAGYRQAFVHGLERGTAASRLAAGQALLGNLREQAVAIKQASGTVVARGAEAENKHGALRENRSADGRKVCFGPRAANDAKAYGLSSIGTPRRRLGLAICGLNEPPPACHGPVAELPF